MFGYVRVFVDTWGKAFDHNKSAALQCMVRRSQLEGGSMEGFVGLVRLWLASEIEIGASSRRLWWICFLTVMLAGVEIKYPRQKSIHVLASNVYAGRWEHT
jgi:hypothetical protein